MSGFSYTLPPFTSGGSGGSGGVSTQPLFQAAFTLHGGGPFHISAPGFITAGSYDVIAGDSQPVDFDAIPGSRIRWSLGGYFDKLTGVTGTYAVDLTWNLWLDSHGGTSLLEYAWHHPTPVLANARGSLITKPSGVHLCVLTVDTPGDASGEDVRVPAIYGGVLLLESF